MARQDHYSNGSVLLSLDAYMMVPTAGESGNLMAYVQDGSAPWTISKNVTFPTTGENNATLQVLSMRLDCCSFPATSASGAAWRWLSAHLQSAPRSHLQIPNPSLVLGRLFRGRDIHCITLEICRPRSWDGLRPAGACWPHGSHANVTRILQ